MHRVTAVRLFYILKGELSSFRHFLHVITWIFKPFHICLKLYINDVLLQAIPRQLGLYLICKGYICLDKENTWVYSIFSHYVYECCYCGLDHCQVITSILNSLFRECYIGFWTLSFPYLYFHRKKRRKKIK